MKIAIHRSKGTFSDRWIDYCNAEGIDYKIISCYQSDIISEISDCDALMWHFHHNNVRSRLFAKQLLFSLEKTSIKVFPDFNTMWHFDDKVGQKYLLEAIKAPLVPTWVFFDRNEALGWARDAGYPKVFKLRSGAGSQNVKLVRSFHEAKRLIEKAFRRGFSQYNPSENLRERWRLYNLQKTTLREVLEGIVRLIIPPPFARQGNRERGYAYFQEFIPGNDHDIRVVVIGKRAFAIKRLVRSGDFRASGSGDILYDKNLFDENTIALSFSLAQKLKSQCVAFDFIHEKALPLLVEISYGFSPDGYDPCPGYWDMELNWHEGPFNPYGWMVDELKK